LFNVRANAEGNFALNTALVAEEKKEVWSEEK